MGWEGKTTTPDRIFGTTVDTTIRQATCHLILIKLGEKLLTNLPASEVLTENSALEALTQLNQLHRWLVPISGGPNYDYGLQLLPALTALNREPEIHLCQIFTAKDTSPDFSNLATATDFVRQNLAGIVSSYPLYSDRVATTAINFATEKQCDAILLGASREGLLHQTIQGNIPEAIARGSNCTVIVVRKAISNPC
jgi:chloride channel protein, CIC family